MTDTAITTPPVRYGCAKRGATLTCTTRDTSAILRARRHRGGIGQRLGNLRQPRRTVSDAAGYDRVGGGRVPNRQVGLMKKSRQVPGNSSANPKAHI